MLIKIYKKEYSQVFEGKDKGWKEKFDYKNLKNLDYQPNQPQQPDHSQQPDQPQQPDQKLPTRIGSEHRFNKLKKRILSVKNNDLKTSTGDIRYNFNGIKKLIEKITNNKIAKGYAIKKSKELLLM